METTVLPYAYALLVFAIVAFLFVLLGRIFLNVETTYEYNIHRVIKQDNDEFDNVLETILREKGKEGWKFERLVETKSLGNNMSRQAIIFIKSKNRIKLF